MIMGATPNLISTTTQMHTQQAQIIAGHLNQLGHPTKPEEVIPITATTPIPKTPELVKVGAEVSGEDFQDVLKTAVAGKSSGVTGSGKFLRVLWGRLNRKKQPDEEVVAK